MKLYKVIVYLITILIIFPNMVNLTNASQTVSNANNFENESYVIKNVSYVSQKEVIFCEFAAIETVLRYYGLNISQIELFYQIGGGFSMAYKPSFDIKPPIIHPPHKFKFWTDETCGGTEDYNLFANLQGLSFEYLYPQRIINKEKTWSKYWENLKNYVKNDTPVVTGIDILAWPPYLEMQNISFILPAIFADSHVVTIIGFNESNSSVCVNDPASGIYGNPEQGTYRWVSKKTFKKAVSRIHSELKHYEYTMLIFKNISKPIPDDISANLTFQRNIQRMKGDKNAYDSDFVNPNFQKYGINALYELKKDLQDKFLLRLPFLRIISKLYPASYPFDDVLRIMKRNAHWESLCKTYISNYLQKNKDDCKYYEKTAKLLKNESRYWENLSNQAMELEIAVKNYTFIKSRIFTKKALSKMTDTIDEIISIEKSIIKNFEEN